MQVQRGSVIGRMKSPAEAPWTLNPFRRRGRACDEEADMRRCYCPSLARFIPADVVAGQVGAVNGHNLYAYLRE